MGEDFAEKDGVAYRILWTQDDSGSLQVLRALPVGDHPLPAAGAGGSGSPTAVPPAVEMVRREP